MSPSETTATPDGWRAAVDLHEPDLRPGDRHGAAREAEPGALRRARHVLRAGVAAVLPRGDGDGGRDVRDRRSIRCTTGSSRPRSSRSTCCSPIWSITSRCTSRSAYGRRGQPGASSSATCGWSPACATRCCSAGAAQLVFLVLFSYAFFFEGFTGLAITVGAIAHALRADADDRACVVGRRVRRRRHAAWPACDGASPWQPLAKRMRSTAAAPAVQHMTLDRAHGAPDAVRGRDAADRGGRAAGGPPLGDRDGADAAHHDRDADQRARAAAAGGLPGAVRAAGARPASTTRTTISLRRTVNLTAGRAAERPRALPGGAAAHLGIAWPSAGGLLDLGRWQRVIFVEFDGGQRRQVTLTMMGTPMPKR